MHGYVCAKQGQCMAMQALNPASTRGYACVAMRGYVCVNNALLRFFLFET